MREIPLTQGKVALVDDDDYEKLSAYRWHAVKVYNIWYAVRSFGGHCCQIRLYMHREVIGDKYGFEIDHIDGDGLNNTRTNLRHVTHRQNCQNRHQTKQSKYPGVTKRQKHCCRLKPWVAAVTIDGKRKTLGYFKDEASAFEAYKTAVKLRFGEGVITS